jgi:hypothetical protein
MNVGDRVPVMFGSSERSRRRSNASPEDEDLETLAMFDALLEREKELGEHSLWLGLDHASDHQDPDQDDEDQDEGDHFSYDGLSD